MTRVSGRSGVVIAVAAVLLTCSIAPVSTQAAEAVRACRFVPGVSVPALMPPELIGTPTPTPTAATEPAASGSVSPADTTVQLEVLDGLLNTIRDHYVYPEALDARWVAVVDALRSRIATGMSDDAFHSALSAMVIGLGDEHSHVQSPVQLLEEAAALAGQHDFVGIGALFLPIAGTETAAVMAVFEGSPAADAGLLAHDVMETVDGGPIRDEHGLSRTRGPAGTSVTLTMRRPGEDARDITIVRRRVTGLLPIDACLVPGTRIGYVFLPTLLDETIDDQVRDALMGLTADGPLDGLVLDDRINGGGLGSVAQSILGLFAAGPQGAFVSRGETTELRLVPEDIGGSQSVPLVVLVSPDTVSYGEILAGVLRVAGRATVLGEATLGNVEQLRAYDLADGYRAWLASATFQPRGAARGVWERTGIVPDVVLPTRWDLFTEATDPALAAAVDLLQAP